MKETAKDAGDGNKENRPNNLLAPAAADASVGNAGASDEVREKSGESDGHGTKIENASPLVDGSCDAVDT